MNKRVADRINHSVCLLYKNIVPICRFSFLYRLFFRFYKNNSYYIADTYDYGKMIRMYHNQNVICERNNMYVQEFSIQALQRLQEHFFYRRLGILYDYAAMPNEAGRKIMPTDQEIRTSKPNRKGSNTGMSFSTRNSVLLLDGILTRIELGLSGNVEDENMLEKLTGGMIRIATAHQRGAIPRSISPEGRSYYADADPVTHFLWCVGAWRMIQTPVLSFDMQEKIKTLFQKVIARLDKDDFNCIGLDEKNVENNKMEHTQSLALLAIANQMMKEKDGKWSVRMAQKEGLKPLPESILWHDRLPMQYALSILEKTCKDAPWIEQVRDRMKDIASLAESDLHRWQQYAPAQQTEIINWRNISPDEKSEIESLEDSTVRASVESALVCLLYADDSTAKRYQESIRDMLVGVQWKNIVTAASLSCVSLVHARGVELGLWDASLLEYSNAMINGEDSISAKYLEDNYDAENPEKSGHLIHPEKEKRAAELAALEAAAKKKNGEHGGRHNRKRKRHKKR